jgi:DNA-binding PadR family transcriptional regulator
MTPVFRHGRLRLYLLRLLDEEPRHGYEVIRLLRDRFMGVYAPSPGTIYPRLARLEEEGLVTHDEEHGRKVYRITEAGREELRKRGDELTELEQELSASVSDIVREVKEDVRETVRSLREELTRAAREMRQAPPDPAATGGTPGTASPEPGAGADSAPFPSPAAAGPGQLPPAGSAARDREENRSARDAGERPRQPLGSAWAQAREQARLLREQARQARDGALGQAAQQAAQHAAHRLREEAASFRSDLGGLREDIGRGDRGDWHSWADWASLSDRPGRPGPHDMAAFRDFERLARGFANDLRKVAWDSGALGGDVVTNLHAILDEALDRIKSEVFGPAPGSKDPQKKDQPPKGD